MSIPEACGLWIEQRVQEELESKKKTGASLRAIGRKIAAEVEKYFETKVQPGTIFQKARRQSCDTNVSKKSNSPVKSTPFKSTPDSVTHPASNRGGIRDGAGRKTQLPPVNPCADLIDTFLDQTTELIYTINKLKTSAVWEEQRAMAIETIESILSLTMGAV